MDEFGDDMLEDEAPVEMGAMGLAQIMQAGNLADVLDGDELGRIARRVIDEYQIDLESRDPWLKKTQEALDLAMLAADEKDYPFEKASNIKFPLLTTAALQFNARAYPAIVSGNRVARCQVWGEDLDGQKVARAERVSEHLSYQLLAEESEWEEDTDRLLVILPIAGCCFRKVYWDRALGRKASRLVTADRMVVNYRARSLEEAPRLTEQMYLYPHEIEERIRSGFYVEFDYADAGTGAEDDEGDDKQEDVGDDDDAPHLFLEQHRLIDLDRDGYPEPYVATVHKGSEKVVRLVPNFTPDTVQIDEMTGKLLSVRRQSFFVKYQFLPSPDGGFYGMGFGTLLGPISESINTTLNMMVDMGHMSTVQGGLISSVMNTREKSLRVKPGDWKVVDVGGTDLRAAMMPIKYDGPNATLFQLLGLLIEAGKEVSAVKDVLTGESRPNQTATATLALIEQGLQVFTSIYKRIHRAIKAELGIHARINREYLTPERYNRFGDFEQMYDPAADYSEADMDILPVSDPNVSTRMQKLAKAEFVMQVAAGNPLINQEEALRRMLQAGDVEDIDKLIAPPPAPPPEEVAFGEAMKQMALQKEAAEIELKRAQANKTQAEAGEADQAEGADPVDLAMKQTDLLIKQAALRKAEFDARIAEAELMSRDVVVDETGTMKDKNDIANEAVMAGLNMLGQLITQQGQATAAALQQIALSQERQAAIAAAPTTLIRDEQGRAIGAQKLIN